MAAQLDAYNLALGFLGERQLAVVTQNCQPRRALDLFWAPVFFYCGSQGMWRFAMRSPVAFAQVTGDYGFAHGYTKPSDLVLLHAVADNRGFNPQIDRDFLDDGPRFYCNAAQLFGRYLSSDPTAGFANPALWSYPYLLYVAAALAHAACMQITGKADLLGSLQVREDQYYLAAYAADAIALIQGQLPFNATAQNLSGSDDLAIADSNGPERIPFAAYRGAIARLAPQRRQEG